MRPPGFWVENAQIPVTGGEWQTQVHFTCDCFASSVALTIVLWLSCNWHQIFMWAGYPRLMYCTLMGFAKLAMLPGTRLWLGFCLGICCLCTCCLCIWFFVYVLFAYSLFVYLFFCVCVVCVVLVVCLLLCIYSCVFAVVYSLMSICRCLFVVVHF